MSNHSENENSLASDALNTMRGICMGCADVVPGVSGGTVALILGIYARLVTAISHIDGSLWPRIRRRQWSELAGHVDLRFLTALGSGILLGVLAMTLLINRLLTNDTSRSVTLAAFFGMILASAVVIATLIKTTRRGESVMCLLLGVACAAFAFWVSGLQHSESGTGPTYPYIFLCGAIAICAMILPGISGAMILLVLGVYEHLTDIPDNLLAQQHVAESLTTVAVFGTGCLISLILFSKLLRWLLGRFHALTMAVLCGFMFGALRKLWPFQKDLTPEIEKFKHKEFEPYVPSSLDGPVLAVLASATIAIAVVFTVDYVTRQKQKARHTSAEPPR